MKKKFKITLTTVVTLNEHDREYYTESPADLHEALTTLSEEHSKLEMVELPADTTEEVKCDWSTDVGVEDEALEEVDESGCESERL